MSKAAPQVGRLSQQYRLPVAMDQQDEKKK
jgi:hypothetical protein